MNDSASAPLAGRRLIYLSPSRLISDAANAVHVMKMAEAFAAAGAEVTLVAAHGEGSDREVFAYYGVTERSFRMLRLGHAERPMARLLARAQSLLPALRLNAVVTLFRGLTTVRRLVRSFRPDVVYARNMLWALSAVPRNVPFVIEVHQMPAPGVQEIPHRLLLRRRNLAGVVVISERLRAPYTERFGSLLKAPVLVSHDGANSVDAVAASDVRHERLQLGYVGHLYPGRGIEILLAVAAALPDAELHIVGGNESLLRHWRAQADLPANVRFHGHIPHAQTYERMAGFDVLLAPYQRKVTVAGGGGNTADYMSPLKIFEYMAAGRAILCSDLPVLREVLRPGENAILVPPEQPDAWVEAIQRLEASPELRQRLGRQARADLERDYSWSARARAIGEFVFRQPRTQT